MDTLMQVISALYVALGEAAGPQALRVANQVLRDAIVDGAVDDPLQSRFWNLLPTTKTTKSN